MGDFKVDSKPIMHSKWKILNKLGLPETYDFDYASAKGAPVEALLRWSKDEKRIACL